MANAIKIVADSSCDLLHLEGFDFASAPLKITNDEKEYIDDENLDVEGMVNDLSEYKGKVSTACPAPGEWLKAFGDAQEIIAISISSKLSGSYNSLLTAKGIYESENPGAKVYALDSLSAGPGLVMLIEKLQELIKQGKDFETIVKEIEEYKDSLGIYFLLGNVHNLANNGRVSSLLAKVIGLLNIKLLGRGVDGEIVVVEKCRGVKKGIPAMMKGFEKDEMKGSKVIIGHVCNEKLANTIAELIKIQFPDVDLRIYQCRGLTSFYAENGGVIVSFEK